MVFVMRKIPYIVGVWDMFSTGTKDALVKHEPVFKFWNIVANALGWKITKCKNVNIVDVITVVGCDCEELISILIFILLQQQAHLHISFFTEHHIPSHENNSKNLRVLFQIPINVEGIDEKFLNDNMHSSY